MSHRSAAVFISVLIGATIRKEIFFTFADISCPKFVTIERNTGGTVACNIAGNQTEYVWYKGNGSSTNPILRLEDGKPSGSEYGKGHYNISTSGAMIISYASLEHEGLYTFLAYSKDETNQSQIISVMITDPENCTTVDSKTLSGDSHFTRILTISATAFAAVVVLVLILIVACFIHKRRNRKLITRNETALSEEEHIKLTTGHVSPPSTQPKGRRPIKDLDENFVHHLKKGYESYCFVQPLPWGDVIPVSVLYTGCQCQITDVDGITWHTSSDKLYMLQQVKNKPIVLIQGEKGSGKKIFFQYFVQRWIEDDEKQFLTFLIPMKGCTIGRSLVETIKSTLFKENDDVTITVIENVLKDFKCVFLLDGLPEICLNDDEKRKDQETFKTERDLTIGTLLRGEKGRLKMDIQVWITTSKEANNHLETFHFSDAVTIEIMPFGETEGKEYIKRVCFHYYKIADKGYFKQDSSDKQPNNTARKTLNKAEKKIDAKEERESLLKDFKKDFHRTDGSNSVYSFVCDFLNKYSIFTDFGKTPDLLTLIIHILVARSMSSFQVLNRTKIENLADLMEAVVMCLEAKCAKDNNISYSLGEWNALRKELEKVAFRLTFSGDTPPGKDLPLTSKIMKEAMSIGILRQRNPTELKTDSNGGNVAFVHKRLQEYFAIESMVMNRDNFTYLLAELKNLESDDVVPILKFLSCLERSFFEEICASLVSYKFYNSFINCLHERSDQEEKKQILKKFCDRDHNIYVRHLNRKDHVDAVMEFCESCKEMGITIGLLSFRKDCSLTYLTSLDLPKICVLELFGMTLSVGDFERLLLYLIENEVTDELRLVECQLPEDMSGDTLNLEQFRDVKLKVTQKRDVREAVLESLNYNTAKWEK